MQREGKSPEEVDAAVVEAYIVMQEQVRRWRQNEGEEFQAVLDAMERDLEYRVAHPSERRHHKAR